MDDAELQPNRKENAGQISSLTSSLLSAWHLHSIFGFSASEVPEDRSDATTPTSAFLSVKKSFSSANQAWGKYGVWIFQYVLSVCETQNRKNLRGPCFPASGGEGRGPG